MDPDLTPLDGTVAGRYTIRKVAGRGGMAVVYLAWDLRHDRPVAFKVMRPEIGLVLGPDRFLREIRIAAHLAHPNIVGVLDSGVLEREGGTPLPWYVMPFLEGPSLAERLRTEKKLEVDEALRIAAEVADALQYAHGMGVIHRDIKPANILLQEGHALVADFGIARMVAEQTGTGATGGIPIGTLNYMSPEQFQADPRLDGRSDIYSLGCVLHEMLSGEPPSSGPTPAAISSHQHREGLPALGLVRPDLPDPIRQAVGRALAPAREDRFASAAEFRDTLNRLRAVRSAGGAVSPARRYLRGAGLIALAGLGVVAAVKLLRPGSSGSGAPAPTRIVVPYFQDLTGGALRDLAGELTVSLTDRLQAVPDLSVTASAMVAPYRDSPLDTLRRRFPADRMVTGTLARSGDSVLVAVRIVDPASSRQLDAKTFAAVGAPDTKELGEALSAFIRTTLWLERDRVARRGQVSGDSAWSLTEEARSLVDQAETAVEVRADRAGFLLLDRADSLLRAARRLDRKSPLIPLEAARVPERRGFLAEWMGQQDLGAVRGKVPDPATEYAAALRAVGPVLEAFPRSAEAHELRGEILLGLHRVAGGDSLLTAAIGELEIATGDPTRVKSWTRLSQAYQIAGRYPESLFAIEQAARVDAYQVNRENLLRRRFETALLAERFASADTACRTGLREWPDDPRFSACQVELWGRSRSDGASAARALAVADSLARNEGPGVATALRYLWAAAVLARAGRGDSADGVAARALASPAAKGQPDLLVEAATLRILRGQPDSALALIAVAVRVRAQLRAYLTSAPWFRPLRQDPRFPAALQGISPPEAGPPRP